jgi:hypothetical protein
LKFVFFRNFTHPRAIILPTFRENPSILFLSLIQSWTAWHLKMESTFCPETSVRNYYFTLRKKHQKSADLLDTALDPWGHSHKVGQHPAASSLHLRQYLKRWIE